MRISELDTPALLVDLYRLEANLDRVAGFARAADLKLRPHTKTHKTIHIAQLQLARGAAGITVAKIGEAEVMADAGIDDIFIAHQIVGTKKIERLLALAQRVTIAVGVDSRDAAAPLSSAFAQRGLRLPVLIEVDVGLHRCGVTPEKVLDFARQINTLPGLNLVGLFTYPGHVYAARSQNEVAGITAYECRIMNELTNQLAPIAEVTDRVSGGSTPTAPHYTAKCGLTEIRAGSYVFNDRTQLDRWSARPGDCALTVLATVVSTPEPGRAVLDAGSKSLAADLAPDSPGHGMLKEDNDAILVKLNEEHGFLDLSRASIKLKVGDKVEVIPNHCCAVCNLFDEMVAARNGEVLETWPVAARGKLR
ncbi:MAG: alanine racemase [Armatimonadota bacterium]|nr:MAG: alanine racemase [Armatimonadota bacterium]